MGLTLNLGKLTFEEDGAITQEHNILLQTAKGQMNVRIEPTAKPGAFPCNFLHTRQPYVHAEDANLYSMLRRDGKDELILEALRAIDATIEGIEVLSPGGTPIMFVRRSKGIKLLPLPLLGDGAVRLVNYILKMALSSLGIILIDEFGFDFHYSVLPSVWEVIHKAANLFQTQVICTTHSLETVESAYLKFTQQQVTNDFQYIRLEKTNDHVEGVQYDPESLRLAIEKRFEVR
jgi:hypothetical protein